MPRRGLEPVADLILSHTKRYPVRADRDVLIAELAARESGGPFYMKRHRGSVLIARSDPLPFGKGRVAQIECLITEKPGDGLFLLRDFLRWADARPTVKWVSWAPMFDWDARFERAMARLGFNRRGGYFERW